MRSLNAKKIAAVVAGAALLGVGLAAAGPVTYSSVPIINNAGQPVVQVVVGSGAQPSDAVAAGNIAAAIGNLAFTSTTKVFPANVTQAQSVLSVGVSPSSYTLTNQKVTLNVSSSTVLSGAYSFTGLIGSVLNHGLQIGSPANTKTLQTGTSYAYGEIPNYQSTPSAYTAAGGVQFSSLPTASYNGGGLSWNGFSLTSSGVKYDNIMQVTNTQLPSLLNNYGNNGETETLWVTGIPSYNQNLKALALMSAGGAYQVSFNKALPQYTASNSVNNAAFSLLGQNWTVIAYEVPGATKFGGGATSVLAAATNTVNGGKLSIASSLSPWTTLYVNDNMSAGAYKVQLTGLGNTNSTSGTSQAAISIYYANSLTPTNTSVLKTGINYPFNVSGHKIFVKVNSTFNGGSFAYQQWAKLQLYTNVYNLTDGQSFNKTNDPGWDVNLIWTNASGSSSSPLADALQSIVIYNATPTTLQQGQSLSFIQSPAAWKLQFVGQTLGSSGFDTLTAALSTTTETYANAGSHVPNNITEPAQLLTVTSGIPNAFTVSGTTGSSIVYDLTPYELSSSLTNTNGLVNSGNVMYLQLVAGTGNNLITNNDQLTATVVGQASATGSNVTLGSATFSTSSNALVTTGVANVYKIKGITLSKALPVSVTAWFGSDSANQANDVAIATLTLQAPVALYQQSGLGYMSTTSGTAAMSYNLQNGQTNSIVQLNWPSETMNPTPGSVAKFGNFIVSEYNVPSSTSYTDKLSFGIYNSSLGTAQYPSFMLNESDGASAGGTRNNMTYVPSSAGTGQSVINAPVGFVTERGSSVGSISPTSVSINYATNVNQLQFAIGPTANGTFVKKGYAQYTYGVGQAVSLPGYNGNVTVGAITATVSGTGPSGQSVIQGINSVVSYPQPVSTPVLLKNLTTAPLVVLDTNASSQDSLVLIGSGYVNSLSKTLQNALNITDKDLNVTGGKVQTLNNQILVAGYTAQQTQQAANTFIQQLYANAATT